MKPPNRSQGEPSLPTSRTSPDPCARALPGEETGTSKKLSKGLLALSSAAVLAVYTAGYVRTRPAAEQFDAESARRRPAFTTTVRAQTGPGTPPPSEHQPAVASAAVSVDHAPPARAPAVPATSAAAPAPAMPKPLNPVTTAAKPVSVTATPPPTSAKVVITAASAPLPVLPAQAESAPSSSSTAQAGTAESGAGGSAADATSAASATASATQPAPYKDGTYTGWGSCRHGDIQASVVVEGGKIVLAAIAQCWTRYSCLCVAHLPAQVVARQSTEVDYVSGATQSGNAFYYAVVDALSKAK